MPIGFILLLLSINVSPLLDWAWIILQWTFDFVWIFCLLLFALIMVQTVLDLSRQGVESIADVRDMGDKEYPPRRVA